MFLKLWAAARFVLIGFPLGRLFLVAARVFPPLRFPNFRRPMLPITEQWFFRKSSAFRSISEGSDLYKNS